MNIPLICYLRSLIVMWLAINNKATVTPGLTQSGHQIRTQFNFSRHKDIDEAEFFPRLQKSNHVGLKSLGIRLEK